MAMRLSSAAAAAVATAGIAAGASNLGKIAGRRRKSNARRQMPSCRVGVVMPVLNESEAIERSLSALLTASPRVDAVVVVDGGSKDDTLERVRRTARKTRDGTRVHILRGRAAGRGRQMNAGAALLLRMWGADNAGNGDEANRRRRGAVRTSLVGFVHADTVVPNDVVELAREPLLSDESTVCVGFKTVIGSYRLVSLHNTLKTFYIPALLRPIAFSRGLRLLFGDQCMFMRLRDFGAVGGFDATHQIMEDADMCLRLHGIERACESRRIGSRRRKGRIRLLDGSVYTSGRRIDHLGGALHATAVHFIVALSWFWGVSPEKLKELYEGMYGGNVSRGR